MKCFFFNFGHIHFTIIINYYSNYEINNEAKLMVDWKKWIHVIEAVVIE